MAALLPITAFLFALTSPLAQEPHLIVSAEWETAGPTRKPITAITSAAEIGGEIWIVDSPGSRVLAFDATGKYLNVVAEEGDGPAEVRSPYLISRGPGGTAAIFDLGRGSIDLFQPNGEFVRRVYINNTIYYPKGFLAHSDGTYWITGGIAGNCCSVHVFSENGALERSVIPTPSTTNLRARLYISGGPLSRSENGAVLYSNAAEHAIYSIPPNGEPSLFASSVDVFAPTGDGFIRTERGRTTFDWYFTQSSGVFGVPGGRVLNVVTSNQENQTVFELYDHDGSYVTRSTLDEVFFPAAITRDGALVGWKKRRSTGETLLTCLRLSVNPDPA